MDSNVVQSYILQSLAGGSSFLAKEYGHIHVT
jgi:hypothetical protein